MPYESGVQTFPEYQRQKHIFEIGNFVDEQATREDAQRALNDVLRQLYNDGDGSLTKADEEAIRLAVDERINRKFPEEEIGNKNLRERIFGEDGIISMSFLGKIALKAETVLLGNQYELNEYRSHVNRIKGFDKQLKALETKAALTDEEKINFVGLMDEIKELETSVRSESYDEHFFSYDYQRKNAERNRLLERIRELKRRKRRLDLKFFGKYIEFY